MAIARARRDPGMNYWPGFVDALSTLDPRHHLPAHRVRGRPVLPDAGGDRKRHRADAAQCPDRAADRAVVDGKDRQADASRSRSRRCAPAWPSAEGERDRFRGLYEGIGSGAADAQGKVTELSGQLDCREAAHRPQRWRRSKCSTSRSRRCAASSRRSKRRWTPRPRRTRSRRARIADLGQRLNVALAQRVQELSRYRSDFFGRLRAILGNRPDIRIVGDRFVFQSEVFFDTGQAVLRRRRAAPSSTSSPPRCSSWSGGFRARSPGCCGSTAIPTCGRSTARSSRATGSSRPRARSRSCNTSSASGCRRSGWSPPASANSSRSTIEKTDEAYSRNRRIELKLTER